MGLSSLLDEETGETKRHPDRAYSPHPIEDELWDVFREYEERFPEEIECDFIEVSPKMTKHQAKAYYDHQKGIRYIRVSKDYLEKTDHHRLRDTMLHEMVHLYTYQKGYAGDTSDGSHMFKWLCGAVGAPINQVREHSDEWQDMAEPFLDGESSWGNSWENLIDD